MHGRAQAVLNDLTALLRAENQSVTHPQHDQSGRHHEVRAGQLAECFRVGRASRPLAPQVSEQEGGDAELEHGGQRAQRRGGGRALNQAKVPGDWADGRGRRHQGRQQGQPERRPAVGGAVRGREGEHQQQGGQQPGTESWPGVVCGQQDQPSAHAEAAPQDALGPGSGSLPPPGQHEAVAERGEQDIRRDEGIERGRLIDSVRSGQQNFQEQIEGQVEYHELHQRSQRAHPGEPRQPPGELLALRVPQPEGDDQAPADERAKPQQVLVDRQPAEQNGQEAGGGKMLHGAAPENQSGGGSVNLRKRTGDAARAHSELRRAGGAGEGDDVADVGDPGFNPA
jgi:hypothetical protein